MTKPAMQRRHYGLIARIIRQSAPQMGASCAFLAERFARELRYTNPNFDEGRFLEACGFTREWTNREMGAAVLRPIFWHETPDQRLIRRKAAGHQ